MPALCQLSVSAVLWCSALKQAPTTQAGYHLTAGVTRAVWKCYRLVEERSILLKVTLILQKKHKSLLVRYTVGVTVFQTETNIATQTTMCRSPVSSVICQCSHVSVEHITLHSRYSRWVLVNKVTWAAATVIPLPFLNISCSYLFSSFMWR